MFYLVHQFGLVSVLPDFHQYDARVEAVEDEQRETDARDDTPRQETVEPARPH